MSHIGKPHDFDANGFCRQCHYVNGKAPETRNHVDPLDGAVLQALGFTFMWPSGNPKEPWWFHPEVDNGQPQWSGRPSFAQIKKKIEDAAVREHRLHIREGLTELLGL